MGNYTLFPHKSLLYTAILTLLEDTPKTTREKSLRATLHLPFRIFGALQKVTSNQTVWYEYFKDAPMSYFMFKKSCLYSRPRLFGHAALTPRHLYRECYTVLTSSNLLTF